MEKLEKRIIEIRENINFLDEKMNQMYSAYEIAKDKKEDAEVNLEILNNHKKEISSKILSKQISKVSIVLVPIIIILFINLIKNNINTNKISFVNNILLALSTIFLSLVIGVIISLIIIKIINKLIPSKILFINMDKEIEKLKKEEKKINKKIKKTSIILNELKTNEKEYVSKYSQLCTKYNNSKQQLDEIESVYFDKTKNIINDLKTHNIYTIISSLSIEDREYIINSIKNNFLNYTK